MPKKDEHIVEGTFTLAELERLYQSARKQLKGCEEFKVPQPQQIDLSWHSEFPSLDTLTGTVVGTLLFEGRFPVEGQRLEVLTNVLRSVGEQLPTASVTVRCHMQGGWVGCCRSRSYVEFEANLPMLLASPDADGRQMVFDRLLESAQLPAVTVCQTDASRRLYFRHNEGGTVFPDGCASGLAWEIHCETKGDSPKRQIQRVAAILTTFQLQPEEYAWSILQVSPVDWDEVCGKVRALALPGVHFCNTLHCQVTEIAGVEFLRRLAGRKPFQTTLCQFPMSTEIGLSRKLGKIIVRTRKDGHRVSLILPDADDALRTSVAEKLGLTLL